jgi:hypothetical protein
LQGFEALEVLFALINALQFIFEVDSGDDFLTVPVPFSGLAENSVITCGPCLTGLGGGWGKAESE